MATLSWSLMVRPLAGKLSWVKEEKIKKPRKRKRR
jgi:hypothetical protein